MHACMLACTYLRTHTRQRDRLIQKRKMETPPRRSYVYIIYIHTYLSLSLYIYIYIHTYYIYIYIYIFIYLFVPPRGRLHTRVRTAGSWSSWTQPPKCTYVYVYVCVCICICACICVCICICIRMCICICMCICFAHEVAGKLNTSSRFQPEDFASLSGVQLFEWFGNVVGTEMGNTLLSLPVNKMRMSGRPIPMKDLARRRCCGWNCT